VIEASVLVNGLWAGRCNGTPEKDLWPGRIVSPLLRTSIGEAPKPGGEPAAPERILGHVTSAGIVAEHLAFFASPAADAMRRMIFTS
jgi:hypothetical protein